MWVFLLLMIYVSKKANAFNGHAFFKAMPISQAFGWVYPLSRLVV